jgi:hypothetical protein
MKKIFLSLSLSVLACLVTLTTFSQVIKVSQEAKDAFGKKFPDAKDVDWANNIGDPEVHFKWNDKSCKAAFTSKGVWKYTETKIDFETAPVELKDGFAKSKYAEKWKVRSSVLIEKPGRILYKVTAAKSDLEVKNLYFNEKGQLQKDNITL